MPKKRTGFVQRLGRGHYRVWYYDAAGKRRSETLHCNEREANARLEELQVTPPEPVKKQGMTVSQFYHDIYHPALVRKGLAPRTIEGYESQWPVVDGICGADDMSLLSARDIEARIQRLPTAGQQNAAFKLLRQMYNYGYRLEYIEVNPMSRKIERSKHFNYYRRAVYDPGEVEAVLETSKQYIYYSMLNHR